MSKGLLHSRLGRSLFRLAETVKFTVDFEPDELVSLKLEIYESKEGGEYLASLSRTDTFRALPTYQAGYVTDDEIMVDVCFWIDCSREFGVSTDIFCAEDLAAAVRVVLEQISQHLDRMDPR